MPNDFADADVLLQMQVCERLKVKFVGSAAEDLIGLGDLFDGACESLHGLRRQINANETGWYIWTGDHAQEDVGFFTLVGVKVFGSLCPTAAPYLGLAPGWRFTIRPGMLDVRFDPSLIGDVDPLADEGRQATLASESSTPAARGQSKA